MRFLSRRLLFHERRHHLATEQIERNSSDPIFPTYSPQKLWTEQEKEIGEAMAKFLLYADEKPVTFFDKLDDAKNRALEFIRQGRAAHIESFIAPAPSDIWRFDPEVNAWVHSN